MTYTAEEFASESLSALAGVVCTPEKGYMQDGGPLQMRRDIEALRSLYDRECGLSKAQDKTIQAISQRQRQLRSELIKIAAEMVRGQFMPSPHAEDWDDTPSANVLVANRKAQNKLNRLANHIKRLADQLSDSEATHSRGESEA